jgi:hypothetical protein
MTFATEKTFGQGVIPNWLSASSAGSCHHAGVTNPGMNPVPQPGWGGQPTGAPAGQPFPAQQPPYGYPPTGGYPIGGQPGQFGQPGYPVPPGWTPAPGPKPPVTQLVTAGLLALSGVLAIVGSFLTLDTIVTSGSTAASSNTGWTFTFLTGTNSTGSATQWLGLSLVIGGALAIVAAVMLSLGGNRPLPLAQPLAIAGAGLAFGATLTVLSTVLTDISITSKQGSGTDTVTDHPGIAFSLLIVSALCAVAVLVVMVRAATRANTPAGTSAPVAGPPTGYAPQVPSYGYGTPPAYNAAPPPGYGQQPMTPPTGYGQPSSYGPTYQQPQGAYPQQQPLDEQPPSPDGQTTHIQPPGQQ